MAVKAKGQITLSSVTDVKATYRYYYLQSSTLAVPTKPTAYPPTEWNDTEPTYTEGSTKSLYFVDCTVFSDDTFSYSEVSLSSSYEAAKTAYNKAEAALKGTITSVKVLYALCDSNTTAPETGWDSTAPEWKSGKYMWQKTVVTYGDGTTKETAVTCISGASGNGIKTITEQYYQSSSATELADGKWAEAYPGWEEGKYIWTRSIIVYTDDSSNTTDAVCVSGSKGDPGRTYILEQSLGILKRQKNNTISPNFIEYNAYYRDGQSTERVPYYGIFVIEESTDGSTWEQLYESEEPEVSTKHDLYSVLATAAGEVIVTADGSAIGIPRDVVNIRCTLYTPDKSTIIDIQSAVVVTDVDGLTHAEIFNLLTNNGTVKGIYKDGDQLYISFTYARGGTLALGGKENANGELIVYDNDGNAAAKVNYEGFTVFVEYEEDGNNYSFKGMRFNSKGVTFVNEKYADGTLLQFDYDTGIFFDPEKETLTVLCDQLTCNNAPKLYNLEHVTSGGYVVFGSDGATLAYLASSSKRYKEVSRIMTVDDVECAYRIEPVWAKYKEGYLSEKDELNGRYLPMFLAEDVEENIQMAAVHKDGQIEDWNPRVMIPVMFQMLKGQKQEIEELKQKIQRMKEEC